MQVDTCCRYAAYQEDHPDREAWAKANAGYLARGLTWCPYEGFDAAEARRARERSDSAGGGRGGGGVSQPLAQHASSPHPARSARVWGEGSWGEGRAMRWRFTFSAVRGQQGAGQLGSGGQAGPGGSVAHAAVQLNEIELKTESGATLETTMCRGDHFYLTFYLTFYLNFYLFRRAGLLTACLPSTARASPTGAPTLAGATRRTIRSSVPTPPLLGSTARGSATARRTAGRASGRTLPTVTATRPQSSSSCPCPRPSGLTRCGRRMTPHATRPPGVWTAR